MRATPWFAVMVCVGLHVHGSLASAPGPRFETPSYEFTNQFEKIPTPLEIQWRLQNLDWKIRNEPTNEEGVILDVIWNLGAKIWSVIEANHPVIDISTTYANALPEGVKSSKELEHFSNVQFQSYRMHGKNLFGKTVYDVTYTLIHRYGGSYRGRGHYLENVTIMPHKVDVSWGYKVAVSVDQVSTVNVGSSEDPVASLLMDFRASVKTVLKESRFRETYGFRGDSPVVQSSDG